MTYAAPTPEGLGTYLGVVDIDPARAQMMIDQAEKLATAITNPLPDDADAVVLSSAARAFTNPAQASAQTAGPFNFANGNIYLTRAERRTLRQMAGIGGGAFSVNPIPVDAMVDYVDPLAHPTADELEENYLDNPIGY